MRHLLIALGSLLGLAVVLLAWPRSIPTSTTGAVPGGASLGLFASDPHYDYAALLDEIAARGSRRLLLVVPLRQTDHRADALRAVVPSSTLTRTARQARERGLTVSLLPIVQLDDRPPGVWRGRLAPTDVDRWFTSYGHALDGLIADLGPLDTVVVGSELGSLEVHEDHWRTLIGRTRRLHSGPLTYAVNWDRLDGVGFWDALDRIGVSLYLPVRGERPYAAYQRRLEALSARLDRPVELVEVGFPAHAAAAATPWDETIDAPVDPALQAHLWRVFCSDWSELPWLHGFYAWNWFGWGGPTDGGFSPRGKPAAAVLQGCWAGST